MAGSYSHVTNSDGTYRGMDLIENLGDADEAIEEMWLMIQWLTKGDKQRIYEAWLNGYLAQACPENIPYQSVEKYWQKD